MNSEWLNDDERHMIQKCIEGDEFYQKKLYSSYVNAMYSRAVRMIGEQENAKDALQDSFIQVFKSLPKYRGESTLGAWIKKIVIHTCLNHLKKTKRLETIEKLEYEEIADEMDSDEAISNLKLDLIHQAIKQLPDGCRNVFNLYLMEGYKHQEIAQIMGISESTSKTQYRRAKSILREELKNRIHE